MISLSMLNDIPGIRHGFFTRGGGVSDGVYRSLNCGYGSGDDPAKISQNRGRAMAMLDQDRAELMTVRQVHSNRVVVVDRPWSRDQAPVADAMATDKPFLALGILTADCAPVLFADADAGVIAAAHAGWKGAVGGIIEATVEKMAGLGARPKNIAAAIGPAIAQGSYEVGAEFKQRFLTDNDDNLILFKKSATDGRFLFDLTGYIWQRLIGAGVEKIVRAPIDTCLAEDRFFSYRRSCLKGEPDYGRGLSLIVLSPEVR